MKATLIAMWRLFHAIFFYPILIGVFIWLFVTGAHWIYGFVVIIAILIFDPIWRILARNLWHMIRKD